MQNEMSSKITLPPYKEKNIMPENGKLSSPKLAETKIASFPADCHSGLKGPLGGVGSEK